MRFRPNSTATLLLCQSQHELLPYHGKDAAHVALYQGSAQQLDKLNHCHAPIEGPF